MSAEVTVKEPGYAYAYISHESTTIIDGHFDDVVMTYTPSNIVLQYNEYYPFGLQTSNSWTRENNANNFLYNEGSELNKNTNWYEMFYRGYDPALGRMLQVDPYAVMYSSYSTYNYGTNNPISFNDPNGGIASSPFMPPVCDYCTGGGGGGGDPIETLSSRANYLQNTYIGNWGGRSGSGTNSVSAAASVFAEPMIYSPWGGKEKGNGKYDGLWIPLNSYEGQQLYINQYGKDSRVVIYDQQQGGPNQLFIYSPDQVERIRNAANDGVALNIMSYAIRNRFVNGKGRSSNYAERMFKKKFPDSNIKFPSNGYSGRFVSGTNGDMQIMGLNFETGQFEQLRLIEFKTNEEIIDGIMRVIIETGFEEVIEHILNLPPIILPPGYFNTNTPSRFSPEDI